MAFRDPPALTGFRGPSEPVGWPLARPGGWVARLHAGGEVAAPWVQTCKVMCHPSRPSDSEWLEVTHSPSCPQTPHPTLDQEKRQRGEAVVDSK